MSLKRKESVQSILNMPDDSEAQVREKLRAAIKAIASELDYIEENTTASVNNVPLPKYLASIEARLTAHGI